VRGATDEEVARLHRRAAEPSLWDAFCGLLELRGLPMTDEATRPRVAAGDRA
jgi:tryptophan 2,3-dioxygenase